MIQLINKNLKTYFTFRVVPEDQRDIAIGVDMVITRILGLSVWLYYSTSYAFNNQYLCELINYFIYYN